MDEGKHFWLIYPEGRRNVPKIKAFREWIVAETAARTEGTGAGEESNLVFSLKAGSTIELHPRRGAFWAKGSPMQAHCAPRQRPPPVQPQLLVPPPVRTWCR